MRSPRNICGSRPRQVIATYRQKRRAPPYLRVDTEADTFAPERLATCHGQVEEWIGSALQAIAPDRNFSKT
jgi:hypothetical protein